MKTERQHFLYVIGFLIGMLLSSHAYASLIAVEPPKDAGGKTDFTKPDNFNPRCWIADYFNSLFEDYYNTKSDTDSDKNTSKKKKIPRNYTSDNSNYSSRATNYEFTPQDLSDAQEMTNDESPVESDETATFKDVNQGYDYAVLFNDENGAPLAIGYGRHYSTREKAQEAMDNCALSSTYGEAREACQ
ncbi:hypothetical protein K1X76_07105 [bacterium]|nr:hypothetical protein [bacterium]